MRQWRSIRRGRRATLRAGMGATFGALVLPALALGQAAAPAGSLPTREELEHGAPPVRPNTPAASRLHVDDTIEHAPCALDDPAYAAIKVHITRATFANLGPVSPETLDAAWKPYQGSEQPIAVLCRIRDAAATALRAAGYLAAVEVPVQRISDGEVRFEVRYARITQVRVIGHPGNNRHLLEAFLGKLVDGQVFNRFRAEREVLLARDIPGYDLYLTLKPAGTGAGAMIAEVRVESTPIEVDATLTDLAAPATGRIGGQLRVSFNGLTGLGDQTTLSAYSTSQFRKQQIWQAGHQMDLGATGWDLSAHVTYAVTRPALGNALPSVHAHTFLANVATSYALLRHDPLTLRVAAGIDLVDQTVTFGGQELSRDRLRVAYLRLDGLAHDPHGVQPWGLPRWRVSGSAELRHGLSILSASPDCATETSLCTAKGAVAPSVALGDPQATVLRTSAEGEFNPSRLFSIDLALRAQWASAPVYAFEQFSLGNYSIGRGYAPGAVVGDDGFAAAIDLRGPWLQLSRHDRIAAQPFVFSDNGWAWRRDLPGVPTADLHALGGGVRMAFGSLAQLDATLAVPLNRLAGEAKVEPPLFLVTLSTRLWPWRYR